MQFLLRNLFNFSYPDILEVLSELLTIVENGIKYSSMSQRLLAIFVLVDIYGKFIGGRETNSDGGNFHSFASRLLFFVVDRIFFLLVEHHSVELETEQQEVKSLINLLHRLVEEHSDLCHLVMEKICMSVKCLAEKHGRVMGGDELDLSDHEVLHGESKTVITRNSMLKISQVLASCLESVDKAGAMTAQIHASMKLLVDDLHSCSLFDCYTHTIYSILFWSHNRFYCLRSGVEEINNVVKNLGLTHCDFSMQYEKFTLECSKKILVGKDYWLAYIAGKYAACHGAWFAASFIFCQLVKLVQSHPLRCWLKSLAEFAQSEMKVQFLLLPEKGYAISNWLESYEISGVTFGNDLHDTEKGRASKVNSSNRIDNLLGVCRILHSSKELLCSTSTSANIFCFQGWYLSLRVKTIGNVVEMLKLLDTIPLTEDNINSNQQLNGNNLVAISESLLNINSLVQSLTQVSIQLERLAQEFDLMTKSFNVIDRKSFMNISALALSCSLLAFTAGFSVLIANLQGMKSSTSSAFQKSEESGFRRLVLDLFRRLQHVDCETSTKLMLLLNASEHPRSHLTKRLMNHNLDISTDTESIITLCSFAVNGALDLRDGATKMHHDSTQSRLTSDSLLLLLITTTKWLQIPFRTPTYFFRIRFVFCYHF